MLLNLKITLTLFVLGFIGVFLSKVLWTKDWQVPVLYKMVVGGIVLLFLISLLSLIMIGIWSL
jgi:hypothetical protein